LHDVRYLEEGQSVVRTRHRPHARSRLDPTWFSECPHRESAVRRPGCDVLFNLLTGVLFMHEQKPPTTGPTVHGPTTLRLAWSIPLYCPGCGVPLADLHSHVWEDLLWCLSCPGPFDYRTIQVLRYAEHPQLAAHFFVQKGVRGYSPRNAPAFALPELVQFLCRTSIPQDLSWHDSPGPLPLRPPNGKHRLPAVVNASWQSDRDVDQITDALVRYMNELGSGIRVPGVPPSTVLLFTIDRMRERSALLPVLPF